MEEGEHILRGRITAITPTARNPERASIRVGRKAVATLLLKRIAELGVAVGDVWDEALAQRVADAAAYDKALRRAMNRLAHRAMSRSTLDRKLRDLEYTEAVRQRVLDQLEALRYLDDEAYGRALIRELQLAKPAGPFLLRQKLAQKGLGRTLIDRLVSEVTESGDAAGQATDLARRRLRQMRRLDPRTRKRRLYGLLARRGFDSETIDAALRAVADELQDESDNAWDA